ncbi:LytTR family DNA-binding domain-containing protein [Asticcacaulis machinosus]|uniref:LytTR family DNA-binding domain-containing protein n=1 Tax=Asticcacaulis machinosus TaxID=2984211 RepID=A0ABT5HLW7_9CAUL|nr:LytTR family DNA-binding domain-containing protein [Asticcacaulis machinosus]MDC7677236.1 LytTR family DNA-binding domain-containing protein [Asticcacaulis machinosus]
MSAIVASGPFKAPDLKPAPLSGPHRTGRFIMVCVCVLAAIMTVSGAYGTRDLWVGHRLLLWGTVASLLVGQVTGLMALGIRFAPRWPLWLTGSVVLMAVVPLIAAELHGLKYTPLLPKAPDPIWPFMGFVAPPVWVVGGVILWLMPRGVSQSGHQPLKPVPVGTETATVRYVRVHDHYLEIHTDSAKRFIRGGLRGYVRGLRGGEVVHRSWWVAYDSVERMERRGRDYVLVLTDGVEVPVARAKLEAVRKALKG